jgi:DNA-binding transcriptional MerR regulator
MQNPIIEKIKVLYQNPDSKILIEDCFNKIFTPLLHTKEIGVTSKQILDWKKAGLLLESDSNQEGWTEFNIRDGIWLKFISELRKFGMPYEDIKRVKNSFLHKVSSIQEKISTLRKNEPNNDAVGIVDDFMKKNLSSIELFGRLLYVWSKAKSIILNKFDSTCYDYGRSAPNHHQDEKQLQPLVLFQ